MYTIFKNADAAKKSGKAPAFHAGHASSILATRSNKTSEIVFFNTL